MHKKILQTGLYTKTDKEAEDMIKRVMKFNSLNLGEPIELDVQPFENGDEEGGVPEPHYKFRFLYPSRGAMEKFWTGSY